MHLRQRLQFDEQSGSSPASCLGRRSNARAEMRREIKPEVSSAQQGVIMIIKTPECLKTVKSHVLWQAQSDTQAWTLEIQEKVVIFLTDFCFWKRRHEKK